MVALVVLVGLGITGCGSPTAPTLYPVNITILGNGSVEQSTLSSKSVMYGSGTSVSLTPIPDAGWAFEHWAGDLTGGAVPALVSTTAAKNITAVFRQAKLLVIDDDNTSWGNLSGVISDLRTEVNALGIISGKLSSASISTADLGSRGDVVWIVPAQRAPFYANMSAGAAKLERFVTEGGILIYCIATSTSVIPSDPPGGVAFVINTQETNDNVMPAHPIAAGIAATTPTAGFTSHGYMTGLPSGAGVIFTTPSAQPTVVEYSLGLGRVFLSAQTGGVMPLTNGAPWNTVNTVLSNMIYHALGLPLHAPRSLSVAAKSPSGSLSSDSR